MKVQQQLAESEFLEERRAAETASEKVRTKQERATSEARAKVFEEFEDSLRICKESRSKS